VRIVIFIGNISNFIQRELRSAFADHDAFSNERDETLPDFFGHSEEFYKFPESREFSRMNARKSESRRSGTGRGDIRCTKGRLQAMHCETTRRRNGSNDSAVSSLAMNAQDGDASHSMPSEDATCLTNGLSSRVQQR